MKTYEDILFLFVMKEMIIKVTLLFHFTSTKFATMGKKVLSELKLS